MTSWRDGVDPQILDDFDLLLGVVRDVAFKNVLSYGGTIPFGVNVGHDGAVQLAAAEPPKDAHHRVEKALDLLLDGAVQNRADIRAAAIVCDVSLETGQDAVRIELEHSQDGPVLLILMPYALSPLTKKITEPPMQVSVRDRRNIW